VITDLAMPGMNGTELARKVRERLSGIEVLYISGYAEELRRSGQIDEAHFLQKPFTPQLLARRVREMLDQRDERPENRTSNAK
jgi:two-component SAPR family response regulator